MSGGRDALYDRFDPSNREMMKLRFQRLKRFGRITERFNLVSIKEIAEWCATKPGTVGVVAADYRSALDAILDSITMGEFGPPTRLGMLWLPRAPTTHKPGHFPLRLMTSNLAWQPELIEDLWALPHLCARWLKARSFRPLPRLELMNLDVLVMVPPAAANDGKMPIKRREAPQAPVSARALHDFLMSAAIKDLPRDRQKQLAQEKWPGRVPDPRWREARKMGPARSAGRKPKS